MTSSKAVIIGGGMTPFAKYPDRSLKSLGEEAIQLALADGRIKPSEIDMAFVANSMSGTITGQTAVVGQTILRDMGFSGIPVFNIDNACASSASAFSLAVQALQSNAAKTVLVVGVEKLVVAADKSRSYLALNGAADPEFLQNSGIDPTRESLFVVSVYPERLERYTAKYGLDQEILAQISVKNRRHAALNPLAQYTDWISIEDVISARQVVGPITSLMCAPLGDGAAAVILRHADQVKTSKRAVGVLAAQIGMGMSPDQGTAIGYTARQAYAQAEITPDDVDFAEVHDSISFNELMAYEELGFAAFGQGHTLVEKEETTLGGKIPINTSGGLESRGHPVAATGLAQIIELMEQLRGEAEQRQVENACIGLAENAGGFAKDDTAAIAITILTNHL